MHLALTALLAALAAGDSASQALKARDQEIRAQLPPAGQEVTPAQRARADAVLTRLVDTQAIAQAALGPRWGKMSGKDRSRFLSAFTRRFRRAIGGQLEAYRSTDIQYGEERQEGGHVLVPTQLTVSGEPTEVTYAMRKLAGGWRIVDIIIDGVSTVENYRTSFAKIISQEGLNGLIARLSRGPETAAER